MAFSNPLMIPTRAEILKDGKGPRTYSKAYNDQYGTNFPLIADPPLASSSKTKPPSKPKTTSKKNTSSGGTRSTVNTVSPVVQTAAAEVLNQNIPKYNLVPGTTMVTPTTIHMSPEARAKLDYAKANGGDLGTGVRDYMTGALGLDNSKIGYSNGMVTYDGQEFLKPGYVENGKSYASPAQLEAAASRYRESKTPLSGTMAIRKSLEDMGYNPNLIGWDDANKTVTIAGQPFAKPTGEKGIIDGVSYLDEGQFKNNAAAFEKTLVPAAEYAASKGWGSPQWHSDGTVSFMGTSMPVVMTKQDGGKSIAYVQKSEMDKALDNFASENPTIIGAYNNWKSYNDRINRALERIENPKEFEYSLEDDPSYQAYREAAIRNGELAHKDTLARMSTMTGGFANSAAITAAAQAQQGYLNQLNDRIPQLYQAAYERYMAQRQMEQAALSSLVNTASSVYQNDFNAAYNLNQLINQKNAENYARRNAEEEQGYNRGIYDEEMAYQKMLDDRNFNFQADIAAQESEQYKNQQWLDVLFGLYETGKMPYSQLISEISKVLVGGY